MDYDDDLTGDVDAPPDRSWRLPEDAHDIPLEAALNTQLQLYSSSFSTDCQPRPSRGPMSQTAAALALLEAMRSRDWVAERLFLRSISPYLYGRAVKPSGEASGSEGERGPTFCSHELA